MQESIELAVPRGILRGMVHRPPAGEGAHHPLLIVFHGFTGTKVDNHFIYPKLCRSLEARGIASLRFDFSGSGESDGDFRDMTLSGELDEARRIFDFAQGLAGIDPRSIFLLGHSMGGLVAGMLAAEKAPAGLVLLAPAGNIDAIISERLRAGRPLEDAPGCRDIGGLVLGREFLPDLRGMNPLGLSARYAGPVMVVQGSADPVVPEEVSRLWYSRFPGAARYIVLEGAGHNYDSIAFEERIFREIGDFVVAPRRSPA